MKLTDLIQLFPESGGIDVPCEVTPGHMSKKYVRVTMERLIVIEGTPQKVRVSLRVCPDCFDMFAYDAAKVSRDIRGR